MKCAALWKFGSIAALLTVAASAGSAWSANCYDLLVGEKYRCKAKFETGFEGLDSCAFFDNLHAATQKLLFAPSGASSGLECTCTAKGSYTAPQYNQGKEFLCGSAEFPYDVFTGKILMNGKKIRGLAYSPISAVSAVVECVNDPTCP